MLFTRNSQFPFVEKNGKKVYTKKKKATVKIEKYKEGTNDEGKKVGEYNLDLVDFIGRGNNFYTYKIADFFVTL